MDRPRSVCLHAAMRNGSSMEYLEHLIARHPQCLTTTARHGGTSSSYGYPLHTALAAAESADEAYELVDLILRHDPQAARRRNMDGSLPLHVAAAGAAIDGRFFSEATERILRAYPSALETESLADGLTPLAVAIAHDNAAAVQLFVKRARNPLFLWASPSLLTLCLRRPLRSDDYDRGDDEYDDDDDDGTRRQRRRRGVGGRHTVMTDRAKLTIAQCLVAANPRLASTKDPATNLYPLHQALLTQQHVDLVRYLLECFPAALQIPGDDERGRLLFPLHIAACCGGDGSVHVVQTLLDFDPALVRQQTTIPAAATTTTSVAAHLSSSSTTDHSSPAERYTALALALNAVRGPIAPTIETMAQQEPRHYGNKDQLLAVLSLLIDKDPEALQRPFATDGTLLLHRCCENKNICYSSSSASWSAVVRLVLDACPAAARHADAHGRLPLHALVRSGGGRRGGGGGINHNTTTTGRLIRALLDAYPAAIATPDARGQLPIHACLATFCPVDDPYDGLLYTVGVLGRCHPPTLLVADHDGNLPLHLACQKTPQHHRRGDGGILRCVELLVQLGPQAATIASPDDHGGIPLAVAAARGVSLDVVYFLARRSPDLFARNTSEGKTMMQGSTTR